MVQQQIATIMEHLFHRLESRFTAQRIARRQSQQMVGLLTDQLSTFKLIQALNGNNLNSFYLITPFQIPYSVGLTFLNRLSSVAFKRQKLVIIIGDIEEVINCLVILNKHSFLLSISTIVRRNVKIT